MVNNLQCHLVAPVLPPHPAITPVLLTPRIGCQAGCDQIFANMGYQLQHPKQIYHQYSTGTRRHLTLLALATHSIPCMTFITWSPSPALRHSTTAAILTGLTQTPTRTMDQHHTRHLPHQDANGAAHERSVARARTAVYIPRVTSRWP